MDIENLTIGDYKITSVFEDKRMFPKTEVFNPETGKKELKSIMIRRMRRIVTLTHAKSGDIVQFTAYIHRRLLKFKDSRSRNGQSIPASFCYAELQRMLGTSHVVAEHLMEF